MVTVDLVFSDAGGGHRAAALALKGVIAAQHRSWNVRLVHLTRVLDTGDALRTVAGVSPEDLYAGRLTRGWTFGPGAALRLMQSAIRVGHAELTRRLRDHWTRTEPDVVVSLVPNFNRVLYESLREARPGVPFVTVMTDLADSEPGGWIEPGQEQYLVCGSARALEQARAAGYPDARIRESAGTVIRREFYEPATIDRTAGRAALGLDPRRATAVVMFGTQGSAQMLRIARALDAVQLILLCGHDGALLDALRGMTRSAPHVAVGFTTEVARYMRLGDLFVGKPGTGSVCEALQSGLPVLTFRNAWMLPQERYTARWIEENGVGRVVTSVSALQPAAFDLIERLDAYRSRISLIRNRAVFDVSDLLAELIRVIPGSERPARRLRALAA
ncbi:MAG: galactosyldiacylglycerol synthase [Burkholderiaceae bacterium]